ncbi:hypothetical protein ACIQF5_21685 [Streptomyces goshikiensis]|uniref:hypothetical protein n=1 Tax=Streptomyces goshikiensis TaxID=1942 RepID=UPI0037F378AF
MTQHRSDSVRLIDLLTEHDRTNGNEPDSDGRTAGYDSFSLLGAAGVRSRMMFENYGPLRQVLAPEHHEKVIQIMAAMWKDGFAVGARSQQTDA